MDPRLFTYPQFSRQRTYSTTYRPNAQTPPGRTSRHYDHYASCRTKHHSRTRSLPGQHVRPRSRSNSNHQPSLIPMYSVPPTPRQREHKKRPSFIAKPKSPPKMHRERSTSNDGSPSPTSSLPERQSRPPMPTIRAPGSRSRRSRSRTTVTPPSKLEEKTENSTKSSNMLDMIHRIGGRFENEIWLARMGDQIIVAKRTKTNHQYAKDDHEIESIILDFQYPLFLKKFMAYSADGFNYILMEHCGTTLQRKIERGAMSPFEVKMITAQLLEAMAYLHDQGIAYLNLHPRHILFNSIDSVEPKLCDFQTALKVKDDARYNTFVGNELTAYCSPERFRTRSGYELKMSDVWAIGVIAYQMMTRRLPFAGKNQEQTILKITNGRLRWPKTTPVSSSFKAFVETCFAEVSKRPSAIAALELEWISDECEEDGDTLSPLPNERILTRAEDDVEICKKKSKKTPRPHKRSATFFK